MTNVSGALGRLPLAPELFLVTGLSIGKDGGDNRSPECESVVNESTINVYMVNTDCDIYEIPVVVPFVTCAKAC